MAPDAAICHCGAPNATSIARSVDEFQPARGRPIQTTAMRHALVVLLLLVVAARAEAGRGIASLKYLPDDTSVVIACDVARARSSPIFKKLLRLARDQNSSLDTLAAAQPLDKQVDTIIVGTSSDQAAVVVLEGRIDKLAAEVKKTATGSQVHAGVTYWTTPDGEVAVIDKRLVFAPVGGMEAVIDRAKNKKAKGPSSVRMIMAATTPKTAVFGGAVLDASARADAAKELGSEPQWVVLSVAMAQRLTLDVRLKFADEASAAAAAKAVNDQLTPDRRGQLEAFVGKDFADSLTVEPQQSFARIAATLTSDELDKVTSVVKMLM